MAGWSADQIKKLVGVEIKAERRLRDVLRKGDRRWTKQSAKTLSRALKLQAKEYERRLLDLNHAHAEAQSVLGTYLPREAHDRFSEEITKWRNDTDLKLATFETRLKSIEISVANLPGGIRSIELGLAASTAQTVGSRTAMTTAVTLVGLAAVLMGGLIGLLTYLK